MNILIYGMEMPTSCEECRTVLGCCDELEDGTVWCRLAHGYIGDERTVSPLFPVPAQGRLIDAEELKKNAYPFPCAIGTEWAVTLRQINDAPTIIPAEEAAT